MSGALIVIPGTGMDELAATDAAQIGRGVNLAKLGGEWIAYESFTPSTVRVSTCLAACGAIVGHRTAHARSRYAHVGYL
jgi:hypothetical protein